MLSPATCPPLSPFSLTGWGRNANGQCGGASNPSLKPAVVPVGGKAKAVAAGQLHSCVTLEDGDNVVCFGSGKRGEWERMASLAGVF